MKIIGILACFFLFFSSVALAQKLITYQDSVAYSAGISMIENLKRQGASELDLKQLVKAISDVGAKKQVISTEVAEKFFNEFMTTLKSKEGETYLTENGKRPEVITLPSGLQYEILNQGPGGPQPLPTDKVKTHYHGMLINGKVFDSSVERGEPISFGLSQVIKGWTEGLQLMSVGDKYKFYIPYHLAYGERGAGGIIPPFAALIFEVELLGINN